jgi:hypothetical protein
VVRDRAVRKSSSRIKHPERNALNTEPFRAEAPGVHLTPASVLKLQRSIGNQATQRLLEINPTNDSHQGRNLIQRNPDKAPAPAPDVPQHNAVDWNNFVSSNIQAFLNDFQTIEVVVSPPDSDEMTFEIVHPPYFLNRVITGNSQKRIDTANAARENAPDFVKSFLYGKNNKPTALARGRSQLEDIRKILQTALDKGEIPAGPGKEYPDGKVMRDWLKKYGIGIDCSGFVQQALIHLVRSSYKAASEEPDRKKNYGVGTITSEVVLNDLKKNDRFETIATPGEARPGDVLTKKGHIRMVMSVENTEDGEVILTFAESTSDKDIPVGESKQENDIGPRAYLVKYSDPNKPIQDKDQVASVKRVGEKKFRKKGNEKAYRLGRFKALDKFFGTHAAPPEEMQEQVEGSPELEAQLEEAVQNAQEFINQENAN